MAQTLRGFLVIAALVVGLIALQACSARGDVEALLGGLQKSATQLHVQMDVTSVAPACTLVNQAGGIQATCVFVEPMTGQTLTSVVSYNGVPAAAIRGVPVLIIQVPVDAADFAGTYGTGGGALVFTPGNTQLSLDAHTNLMAEAGMQLVLVELPATAGPGTYYLYLSYNASSTQLKGLAAGKVTFAGRTFYPTLMPCTATFADVPLIPVPQTPIATIIDIRGIKAAYVPCAGKVYDFSESSATTVTVVEYYNAALDHYFITWIPNEIAILDAGITIRGWLRTSRTFKAYAAAQAGTSDICRYYIPPAQADSHFFGRGTTECNATGVAHPNFVLEDPKFMQMFLPTAGNCPTGTIPVYRVFSNRKDANHRYMIDRAVRDQMVLAGWLAEGDGPDLVVMCAPPEQTAVVIAAGDIAWCDVPVGMTQAALTALLVDSIPGTVLTLGDNAYFEGTAAQFDACYAPTWGRFKSRTNPSPGNHDYRTAAAAGYFDYFGDRAGLDRRGYYSFDVGAWHLISLNSNVPATPGSVQDLWLRADLSANLDKRCVLAYWHHPVFSSGPHGNDPKMAGIWQTLYDFGADVVLAGHDHDYERFGPQDAAGRADATRGLRSFVVGTGGAGSYAFATIRANSEARVAGSFGVIRLTLRNDRFQWEFIDVAGVTRDSGEAPCH